MFNLACQAGLELSVSPDTGSGHIRMKFGALNDRAISLRLVEMHIQLREGN